MNQLGRLISFMTVIALIVPVIIVLSLARYTNTTKTLEAPVVLEIHSGVMAAFIATQLSDAGIGSSALGNYWSMRLWGKPSNIKAGIYRFVGEISLQQVFDDLALGKVDLVSITLPEGLTANDMAVILEEKGITSKKDFIQIAYDESSPEKFGLPGPTLEGYLFPDTYRFARDLEAKEVISAMILRFKSVAKELSPELQVGKLNLQKWVTLASIIEKETGAPIERPRIASVFLNRLKKRMRLETDPTVIYGIKNFDGNIRKKDLRTDNPYNTYTRHGLPLGPIASPGKESLKAVLYPAKTDYLYFVSKKDGTHYFSKTYKEHLRAVRKFQLRRK
jgi:UPF0755 protein